MVAVRLVTVTVTTSTRVAVALTRGAPRRADDLMEARRRRNVTEAVPVYLAPSELVEVPHLYVYLRPAYQCT